MRLALTLCSFGLAAWAGQAEAQSAQGAKVVIEISKPDGGPISPAVGDDMRVAVTFTDALDGRPIKGLQPRAWMRRVRPGGPSCGEAAWMVRATGRIASGDLAFDGASLVSIGSDPAAGGEDRLRVVDLTRRLRAADQVSVTPLGGPTRGLMVHPQSPRAFVTRPASGDILAIELPQGGVSLFATGLDRPVALAPFRDGLAAIGGSGRGWLKTFDSGGQPIASMDLEGKAAGLHVSPSGAILATDTYGSAILFRDSKRSDRFAAGTFIGPVSIARDVIAAIGNDGVALRWLDDPSRSVAVPFGFAPSGLQAASDGRHVVAWNGSSLAVYDAARGAMVKRDDGTPFSSPLPKPVAASISANGAVFLAHAGPSVVTVIDLTSAQQGGAPTVRQVRLSGPTSDGAGHDFTGRLIPAPDAMGAIALPIGSNAAFSIGVGGGLSDAPMSATALRGDTPREIAGFARKFAEMRDGSFEAVVRPRKGGRYEIVATTGAAGTTACASVSVTGPGADDEQAVELKLVNAARFVAGAPQTLRLTLTGQRERPAQDGLAVRVDDLSFGWSKRVLARKSGHDSFMFDLIFPEAGRYALSVERADGGIAPLAIDVDAGPPR